MSRCHLHLPLLDSSGNVFPYASVTFNDPDTGSVISEPIYVQSSGGNPVSLPLFCDPGVIDVWTDNPVRVQIVAIVANNVRIQLNGVDLLPEPTGIVQSVSPVRVTGQPDAALDTAVLMSSGNGEAAFRVADPLATHQHSGDSAGSVVLTGEDAADFDPYQTWVGYHAGENIASNSTGATAIGAHADIQGTSVTQAGIGQVTAQPATGILGDMATVLSSEDGTATNGTTAIGAANLTAQGAGMTVVGSLNGPSSPSAQPDNAVVVGAGNVVGAAGSVKIGPNHPTSQAGPNNTVIGVANVAQNNLLPWANGQTPTAVGATTLAGDPSTALSSDDWFGGVGPLSRGVNSTTWNPSLTTLTDNAVTQAMLYVGGDVITNGQRTYSNASTTLGFFGATGIARPSIPYAPGDVANTQLTSLMHALANIGLIYVTDVPCLAESGTHADGTQLEFAETGQSLQWKLPPSSPAYRSANPFTVAGNKVVLNAANGPYPSRGCAGIYSSGRSDVSVQGRFTYNATSPAGTNAITNYGFETDTTGWQGWDPNVTIARDTTRARYGDASLKISPSTTADYSRAATTFTTTPGTQMNWSIWVYPQWNHQILIGIDYFDASWNYLGNNGATNTITAPTLNTWTRINVSGTAPANTANMACTIGYINPGSLVPVGHALNVDGAMLQFGTLTMGPFVDNTGFNPEDYATGLMLRTYNAQSVVGGNTQAVVTGYLVGRKAVYSMADNAINSTVATLSASPASGDLLQADCSGTGVTVRVNGTSVATFTDSTLTTRVKHGYRICPSTSAYSFQVLPFGF